MAVRCARERWTHWLLAGALLAAVIAYGSVRAELLSDYFPQGVPGYGTTPGVTVASRMRPDFEPPSVRVGSFLLHPKLEEGLGYDSNVFGSGNALGSWLVGSHPSLLIGSD